MEETRSPPLLTGTATPEQHGVQSPGHLDDITAAAWRHFLLLSVSLCWTYVANVHRVEFSPTQDLELSIKNSQATKTCLLKSRGIEFSISEAFAAFEIHLATSWSLSSHQTAAIREVTLVLMFISISSRRSLITSCRLRASCWNLRFFFSPCVRRKHFWRTLSHHLHLSRVWGTRSDSWVRLDGGPGEVRFQRHGGRRAQLQEGRHAEGQLFFFFSFFCFF